VIVPTWNRPGRVRECVSALLRLRERVEIIVVDDGSEPGVREEWEGSVRVLRQSHRRGPAAARNLGAAAATGEYLLFTDDDCVPEANWVTGFRQVLDRHPRALMGGSVRNGEPGNWAAEFNEMLVAQLRRVTMGSPCGFVPTNNLCVAAEQFRGVGGFNESFVQAGGEDRDFCQRWWRAGKQIVAAEGAVVFHHHPQSMGAFWAMHRRYGAAARHLRSVSPQRSSGADRLRLYRAAFREGHGAPLVLSQLAVCTGYVLGAKS
jgi:GT2 family glycosyltransferase